MAAELLNTSNVYEWRVRSVAPNVYDQEIDIVRDYVYIPGAGPASTIYDALAGLRTFWRANILDKTLNVQTVGRYELRSITGKIARVGPVPPGLPPFKLTFGTFAPLQGIAPADNGTRASTDPAPPTDSASIQIRGEGGGRGAFGMTRFGLIDETDIAAGVLVPGSLTVMQGVAAALANDVPVGLVGELLRPVIFNKTAYLLAAMPVLPTGAVRAIISTEAAKVTGTQLSRKRLIRRPGR